jgi:hypothetical protein
MKNVERYNFGDYFSAGFVVIRVIREKQKRNYKLGIWKER